MKDDHVPYYEEFRKLIDDPLPEMAEYFEAERQYIIDSRNSAGVSAIDVGCGPGRMLVSSGLSMSFRKITGIDRDPRMIEAAREAIRYSSCDIRLFCDDFLKLWHFPWRRADIVFASYNLPGDNGMNEERRLELVRQMLRFTKPGGHAIVSFWKPMPREWLEHYYARAGIKVLEFLPENEVRTSAGTFKRFTDREIRDLAIQVGGSCRKVELTPMWNLVDFSRPKS